MDIIAAHRQVGPYRGVLVARQRRKRQLDAETMY